MGDHYPPRDLPRAEPPSEDDGARSVGPEDKFRIVLIPAPDGWMDLPKTAAYVDGMVVYSASVHEHLDGWRVILKAKRRGKFWVTFINAESWTDALEGTVEWAETGTLQWWPDKYPPK